WSVPNPGNLVDGDTISATATDPAGNTSLPGTEIVDGDGLPPVVSLTDEVTNDATPDLSGSINDPNATIVVTVDGIDYPAVNNGDGTWTLPNDILPTLSEGAHSVTVTATDLAGNVGTDTGTVTIDTVAPNAPDIDPVNAVDPITGTAEPDSTVTVSFPDGTTATVVAGPDGTWSVPNPGNLVDGDTISATATDPAGNTSLPGTEIVDGDGLPPVVSLTDEVTNDATPDLSGSINDPNATIVVTVDGIDYPAVNNGDGTWTLPNDILPTLSEGAHSVTVTATDLAGNVGTDTGTVTIDTVAPVVTFPDVSTNDTTPALTGTIDDPLATIVVTVDGVDYPAVNNGDGTWTLADNTLPALTDGPHTVSVTATDVAGNVSTPVTGTVTVDATAPTLAITAADLNLGLGESTTVTFTFSEAVTGFDATDITLVGGTLAGLSTADGGLTWTATFTQDGTATAPSISVADNTYTDLAGNLGTGASLAGLTSDVVAPTLAITATDLNLGLGESTTVTFTFSEAVTGFDASDVTLAGGTLAGLSTADGGLTWTATFTQDGTATAPSISVADNTYTDLAGNLGTGASLAGLTADVVAPTLAITATDLNLGLDESTTVTFTFSEAVTGFDASDVTLAGGTLAGLSTADGGLTWTAT
ncbi:Ig-like domain-containing protein, partial [Acinetobacter pittii]|uniref:Ig-like domain-containing protein n=2 Tax=Acinetobacter pittii TaxID=48296 RepID=UPI0024DEE950